MFITDISEFVQHTEDHYQIILILNKVNILAIELEADLYQHVCKINQINELCNEFRQVISKNKLKLHSIKLKNYKIVDDVLFRKDLL
jgi:hypothetical protein